MQNVVDSYCQTALSFNWTFHILLIIQSLKKILIFHVFEIWNLNTYDPSKPAF